MTYDLSSWLADRTNPDQFAQFEYGTVTAVSGFTTVTVNLAGLTVSMPAAYPAVVGDVCMVVQQGDRRVAVRSMGQPNPLSGTVTATGTTVTVTVNGVTGIVLRRHNGYSPTIGDSVHIVDGAVLDKWALAPPPVTPPAPPPAPPAPPASGITTFAARDAATFRNGGWRTDSSGVYQGNAPTGSGANSGAWFYHAAPWQTLAGATCTAAQIYLHRTRAGVFGAQNIHLYLHTSNSRPAGDVTRSAGPIDFAIAVDSGGWMSHATLVSWMQQILNGTGHGFGITGSPYARLASLAEDPASGSIRIWWTR